jgi:potassium-transporting ATPase potassium-binding subunit
LYLLLPLSLVVSIFLISQGVVQNFSSYDRVDLVQPITLSDGTTVTSEVIPQGLAASQIAIKQLGTNGGGFFGVNSAHPFENPTAASNLVEMLAILLIPAALCFTFGRNVKDKRQGVALFLAMFVVLSVSLGVVLFNEMQATPQLAQNGAVSTSFVNQSGGNMEGKEVRFGIAASSTWGAFTTAASNGSVNAMHDSFTPIGGMILMLLMQLGEVIFGGVGSGLYGMLGLAIFTVFIAGLMVGRTPEYLGKKVEPFEIKMAVLLCLATPVAILIGSGIACMVPGISSTLTNTGALSFFPALALGPVADFYQMIG